MKLSIIIPVFNEANTVEEIIKRVIAVSIPDCEKEIIVVDDGSDDGTGKILETIKKEYGFLLLRHLKNSGKGAAVRSGLKTSSGDLILIQDGDLEYNPADYHRLLKPILAGKAAVVYGSRNLDKNTQPFYRIYFWGGKIISALFNLLFQAKLTDIFSGYKVFKKEVLAGIDLSENGFGIESELTAKIAKSGVTILETPISYCGRSFKQGKKIRSFDGLLAIWKIIKYRIK
ncbi:glycosyl transferase [Candidatus Kuenenbacteria bacterium CG_4_9_14_3_um_filter_39_14]|uniref:Glycosyl transferase n=7 Tax=Candidatus Kueneniibacteriota TaxID=1752740 RepID=A0A2M7IMP3_9BACT|nr:glycosyltransferase family 2 protein [Candidatus Kuenenbacteria bacterium]OIP56400.1 MAG: hypothetical protein AUK13_01085 [Candidatus Kuenenbacteria bacterium CG2_30_39_24]PIP28727.1 MAG: glycosyl transferase [Candidatus Kuenenbacteria bacterium CG23_combo_of_CG06-09_8_20_14_all_39_39]PIP75186.1 MAG: glycosyl transferase [Candidatus Kuenenbacteria bacterium CG22_combo_CG10-13_8_21_14_all_39_9]PIR80538.1 MAG: glycosyl transferase [Candidatus Kuenenbacteria bacterium CG10_big_fil_rev_8_21_14_